MRRIAVVLAGCMVLAGCGGGGGSAASTVTATATVTATSMATVTVTADPEPSAPPAPLELRLGEVATLGVVTLQPSEVKEHARPNGPARAVLVKACATTEAITPSWLPWTLVGDDSGTYPASGATYGDDPRPQYPFDGGVVEIGKCAKGWIMFDMPVGVKLMELRYVNQVGERVTWSLA